jgi:hypothetical protein
MAGHLTAHVEMNCPSAWRSVSAHREIPMSAVTGAKCPVFTQPNAPSVATRKSPTPRVVPGVVRHEGDALLTVSGSTSLGTRDAILEVLGA